MPHFDFDAALRQHRAEQGEEPPDPVTFHYGGELFTVVPAPMLGDVIELHEAPEPTPETEEAAALVALRFVRRLLPAADRARFDQAHYRIPAKTAPVAIIQLVTYITESITSFPTEPPVSSAQSPSTAGRGSSGSTGGPNRSSEPRRGRGSGKSTNRSRSA